MEHSVRRLFFEDVELGQELPVFERYTHFEEWNRYAAVNDEFVPIHMDDVAGRAAGNEGGAFGMGNLRLSYLINMIREWTGDDGELTSISLRYRATNQQHDHLRCRGEVVAKDVVDGRHRVHLRLDVLNQEGRSTTPATATVVLPVRGRSDV